MCAEYEKCLKYCYYYLCTVVIFARCSCTSWQSKRDLCRRDWAQSLHHVQVPYHWC